jgi:hypothetical protein
LRSTLVPDIIRQVTSDVRREPPKRNTLLAHCLARAVIAEHGGVDAVVETYGEHAERLGKWAALKAGVRVAPKAARVAGFVIAWAVGMREEERDEYSITEYQRFWKEGERQAYRLQSDFRELWPEFETPNELAHQVMKQLDSRKAAKEAASLAATVYVTA